MRGDGLIRFGGLAAVGVVAAIAAIISYSHIYDLASANGGLGISPALLPFSIDGLIVGCSLVMLGTARHGLPAPPLARGLLIFGVLMTIAANMAFGASFGWLGAVIWAVPSIAFVGCVEVVLLQFRQAGHQVAQAAAGTVPALVPGSAEDAARVAFQASIAGGNPLSQNQLTTRFGITRGQAADIRSAVTIGANGHGGGS